MNPPQPIPVGMEPPPLYGPDERPRPTPSARPPDQGDRPKGSARNATAGRFAILNSFVDVTMADLSRAELAVWLVLYRDTKSATGTARTGQSDIARRAGLDPRSVRRALASLTAKGLVRVVRRGRLNAGPSVYRVRPVERT